MPEWDKHVLLSLITDFCQGNISAEEFSDRFAILYDQNADFSKLSELEEAALGELSSIASRFSPFQEDIERYGCYYSAEQVRKKAQEVLDRIVR